MIQFQGGRFEFRHVSPMAAGYCGGGGSSKSSSSTSTATTNIDRRLAVDTGGVGVSTDNSTVNITMLDGGALEAAQSAIDRAFALIDAGDARQNESLDDLLKSASEVFMRGADIAETAMVQTKAAYDLLLDRGEQAAARESGQLDQRTITVLSIAAAGVAMVAFSKKR